MITSAEYDTIRNIIINALEEIRATNHVAAVFISHELIVRIASNVMNRIHDGLSDLDERLEI
jgi:hypothetical protein